MIQALRSDPSSLESFSGDHPGTKRLLNGCVPEIGQKRTTYGVTLRSRVRGLRRLPGALQRSWIGSKPWIIAFCPSFLQKSRGACIRHPWWEQRTREIDAGLQSLGNLARSPTPHAEGRDCGAQHRAGDAPRRVASQNPHADSLFRRVMAN